MEAVEPKHLVSLPHQLTATYGSIVFEGKNTHTPASTPTVSSCVGASDATLGAVVAFSWGD